MRHIVEERLKNGVKLLCQLEDTNASPDLMASVIYLLAYFSNEHALLARSKANAQ
jgi:hypothetical protein